MTTMRGLLAIFVLGWTAFGLLWALAILLPVPTLALWIFAVLVSEFSLLLAAFALVGLCLAALIHRAGARRVGLVSVVLAGATLVISLVPVAQAWRTAGEKDVALSFSEYFAGLSVTSDRSPAETRVYARPEGGELRLDVWTPQGAGQNRPAVVMVHGGAWEMGARSESPRWNTWLNERGYVVFDIDYRLMPPPRWQDAPGDVKCAVGWVKQNAGRYGVDPDRVALMGSSAGAHLALLAAYTANGPDLPPSCPVPDTDVSAVVAVSPPTDLDRLYEDQLPPWYPDVGGLDTGGRETLRRFTGGAPDGVPVRYQVASPINHVDRSVPPTFLVHGGRDQIVPPVESENLAEELRAADVSYRLLELPYARHYFEISWGGWGSQITRPALHRFLEEHVASPDNSS